MRATTRTGRAARHLGALTLVLRGFALFAVVTGVLDLLVGAALLVGSGARLPAAVVADPVLNSQIGYLGAVWAGYGAALWWTAGDLRGRAAVLNILLGTLWLGGIGRLLAALRFGVGPPVFVAFIVLELVGPPAVFAWRRRLPARGASRRSQPPPTARAGVSPARWRDRGAAH